MDGGNEERPEEEERPDHEFDGDDLPERRVSPRTDSGGKGGDFPPSRYRGEAPRAGLGPRGSPLDLFAIEAILNSPIDSQRIHPPRTRRTAAEPGSQGPHGPREQGLGAGKTSLPLRGDAPGDAGIPRNALLSSPTGAPPKLAPSQGSFVSARAFERFRRTSSFRPRTAFLTSPALGPRPHQQSSDERPADAPVVLDQAAEGSFEMDPNEPLLTEDEINAFFNDPLPVAPAAEIAVEDVTEDEDEEVEVPADAVSAEPQRPRWLKNQVADLADLVQALDLQARAHHAHVGLEGELSRLRQFTRTMGFVAAPPPKGLQEFDVATLVEEALGAIAGATPDAPRILFRKRGNRTDTVADKALVAAAVDALLQTAIACASSGDVVRITVEGRVGELIVTEVQFPPGPIADLHPDQILTPYALRKILPNIGPNALAAAGAIAVGQGGDMCLMRNEDGTATFLLELQGND